MLKENTSWHLLKTVKKILFKREDPLQWDFVVGNRDEAQFRIQPARVEIYSQGARWVSVNRKLLRGNIKARGILAIFTEQNSC